MNREQFRALRPNIALLFGSLLFCFLVFEIGYRVLDPFPFFSRSEINQTEYGNLSTYDETLGWKGVPRGKAELVTTNNRVWLAHNKYGFRDIEHDNWTDKRPVVAFLGDSFTWGFEVEFEEMFVNRLREMLPSYQIFNLAHRGYGTDQELLTFKRWRDKRTFKLVILMFSENDVEDNNSMFQSHKPKPKYQLVENELVLVGVPVPKREKWTRPRRVKRAPDSWWTTLKENLLRSHFLHDVYFRYEQFNWTSETNGMRIGEAEKPDLILTSRILEEFRTEAEGSGAKLVVCFVPSKRQIEQLDDSLPYQIEIAHLCQQLGLEYLDLAPNFKNTWYRTYYRRGMHWNSCGHKLAAEALYDYLTRNASP